MTFMIGVVIGALIVITARWIGKQLAKRLDK